MVIRQGNAVWVDNQEPEGNTDVLRHYADALCVPLVARRRTTIGAIHVYLENGRFRQSDFDFVDSAGQHRGRRARPRPPAKPLLQATTGACVDKSPGYDELIGESEPMRDLKVARSTASPGPPAAC